MIKKLHNLYDKKNVSPVTVQELKFFFFPQATVSAHTWRISLNSDMITLLVLFNETEDKNEVIR